MKDIAAGSSAGAVDTKIPLSYLYERGSEIQAHSHATLRRQAQLIDGVIRGQVG